MVKRYLVTYKTKNQASNIESIERCIGKCGCKRTKLKRKFDNFPEIFVLENPSPDVLQELENDPNVLAVEEDSIAVPMDNLSEYNPTAQAVEWSHLMSGINEFHSRGYTGTGVKVGIIDTGFANHEDLVYAGRYNAYDSSVPPEADTRAGRGHGTQSAGIIGMRNNSLGYLGVAPSAQIYGVKADDNEGSGIYHSAQIAGIDWLVSQGVKIISCSYSGPSEVTSTKQAYQNAFNNHDVLFICAAGNEAEQSGVDPNNCVGYPAKWDFVVAVGCISKSGNIADYSSRGPELDVSIGGDGVMSTAPSTNNINRVDYYEVSNRYVSYSGTSCATPHVAGIAALYRQMYPSYTASQIRNLIQTNVLRQGTESKNRTYGNGLAVSPWTDTTSRFFTDRGVKRTLVQYRGDFYKYVPTVSGEHKVTISSRYSGFQYRVFESDGSTYVPQLTNLVSGRTYYVGIFRDTPQEYAFRMGPTNQMPGKPTVSVQSRTDTTITLQFSATNATEYRVQAAILGSWVGETTGNTYTITGLTPGGDYTSRWYVVALNVNGESERSDYIGAYTNPSTPSLTVGSPTTSSLTLTYSATGAKTYDIYRNGTRIVTARTSTSYTDTGLSSGTTYSYYVVAKGEGDGQSTSPTRSGTTQQVVNPPGTVSLSVGSPTSDSLTLTYSASGATSYDIYRDGTRIVLNRTQTSYTDTGLQPATSYSYYVVAKNSGGTSTSPTRTGTTLGIPPSKPTLSVGSPTETSLTLTYSATGATSYDIYRNDTLIVVGRTSTTYTDTGLSPDTTYSYYVVAKNEHGNTQSDVLQGKTAEPPPPPPPPPPPSKPSLNVINPTERSLTLVFSATGAASYDIYRNGVNIASDLVGSTYTDTGLLPNATYSYYVVAKNSSGNAQSDTVYGTTLGLLPERPEVSITNPTTDSLTLIYNAIGGKTYNIYRDGIEIVADRVERTYVDTGLTPDTDYSYYVVARNEAGESPRSNTVTGRTLREGGLPPMPGEGGKTLSDIVTEVNELLDENYPAEIIIPWINDALRELAVVSGAVFPRMTINMIEEEPPIPDKYRYLLVLYGAAKGKEKDSSVMEAQNFMSQFINGKVDFATNYTPPEEYRDPSAFGGIDPDSNVYIKYPNPYGWTW